MGLFGSTSSRRSALLALFFVASAAAVVSADFPDGFSCKESKDGVTGSAARYISAKPGVKDKVTDERGLRGGIIGDLCASPERVGQFDRCEKKLPALRERALSQGRRQRGAPFFFLSLSHLLNCSFPHKKKTKTGRLRRPLRRQPGLHQLHLLRRRRPRLRQRVRWRAPDSRKDVHARRGRVQAGQGAAAAGREARGV